MKPNKEIVKLLSKIAQQNNGIILPKNVVDAARPKTSIIHNWFDWDNGSAAEKYRIWQARQLLSVTVELVGQKRLPMRCFVSLTPDRLGEGGYRVTTEVLSDAQRRAQMLADALAELQTFEAKYSRLKEFAELFAVARRVRRGVATRPQMAV